MRKFYSLLIPAFFILLLQTGFSQESSKSLWNDISTSSLTTVKERLYSPEVFRSINVDFQLIKGEMQKAPMEDSDEAIQSNVTIEIPAPDGKSEKFIILESPVMHPDLAAQFPFIKTFSGRSVSNPLNTARFDFTEWGFHAMVMSPDGWYFIEPFSQGNVNDYISYYKKDSKQRAAFECIFGNGPDQREYFTPPSGVQLRTSGPNLRTYRLALACTGEYTTFHGGTTSGALSAMVTSVNRVDGVYEAEVAVRLVLIANTNLLIYTNATTDPYTNNSGGTMLTENISNVNSVIGSSNYDIGHVFSTGGGGVAYLGCVCGSNKAGGVTGSSSPVGDNFDIDYVAHEMGHQFGGNHTFNSVTGSCNGNRSSNAAYEPGSGTTIMAYAGICGADDIQPHSDAIFHSKSYDEIQIFITGTTGNSCAVTTSTGNNPPIVNAGSNYSIPYLTLFRLTGSATDADGDPLTYLWEEYDQTTTGSAPNSPTGNSPIFRVFTPTTNPSRTFPRIEDIVRNQQTLGEILPSYARTLNFKFTARDNKLNGGGVGNNTTNVQIAVINTGAAFSVTSPNTNLTWTGLSSQTVTWNVSSTTASPINCANVNILLSVDSGYTFPYTLQANTANDGSEIVTIPNVPGNKNRIKVESVGNVFFDMSDINFTISAGSGVLTDIFTNPLTSNNLCAGSVISVSFSANGIPNSGNNYTVQLSNASGSFASGVTNIGSLLNSTISSGNISATIPGATTPSALYRIRVVSSNPAINGTDNGSNISISQAPVTPGAISGLTAVCQGQTSVSYFVSAVTNATGYSWTLPSGATIISGTNTNSITVNYSLSAVSGNVTVAGTNSGCGAGSASTPLAVTVSNLPSAAGAISGPAIVCQSSTGNNYFIASVPYANSYVWSVPSGASITSGAGTNSILVSYSGSAVSGNISVYASNACGTGTPSVLALTVNLIPTPAGISASGPVNLCAGMDVDLSFTPSSGINYQWRKNNVDLPSETGPMYTATNAGTYDVRSVFTPLSPQSFSNNTSVSIPDNSCTGASSTINVAGYTSNVFTGGISIQLNITHTYVGDLVLILVAPDGKKLGLSNRVGSSGDNFTNTVFSDTATVQLPTLGAPYGGVYKPWTSKFNVCVQTDTTVFGGIGAGSFNPNGNWTLWVYDRANLDLGTIDNWTINFPGSTAGTCQSYSNSIIVTEIPLVTISTFSPSSGSSGTSVLINGGDFTGTSMVLFNGVAATFSLNNSSQISATVPAGAGTGLIQVIDDCGSVYSSTPFNVTSADLTLHLSILIEGFYRGSGQMIAVLSPSVCDTVEVGLADPSFPHAILFSAKGIVDLNGVGDFTFIGAGVNEYYYIVVKHRNSLEVWSADSISFYTVNISYNFTNLAEKAFGNNQVSVGGGKFAMYSGDVNQDGVISSADLVLMESGMQNFLQGYYPQDLTGDSVVESADFSVFENNDSGSIGVLKP